MKQSTNYMRIIPNSHFYTELEQLISGIKFDIDWHANKVKREEQIKTADHPIIDMYKPLTTEYLIIGLVNSKKNGYHIKFNKKNVKHNDTEIHFPSIDGILEYLRIYRDDPKWTLERFKVLLEETINNGYNLKNERKMERNEVYECIDTERQYQDLCEDSRRKINNTPDTKKQPAEWINYIEFHLAQAKREVYSLHDESVLAELRKVAALTVRCLELHGCPERIIPEKLLSPLKQ